MRLRGVMWGACAALGLNVASAQEAVSFATDEGTWMSVDVAPDGRTLLFDLLGDVYRLDIAGGEAEPVLRGSSFDAQATFSPTGTQIAFISDRGGSENVWIAAADGGGARALGEDTDAVYLDPAWSADGQFVYVTRFNSRNRLDSGIKATLWRFAVSGGGAPVVLPDAEEAAMFGVGVSKDGRFLYGTNAGRRGKYVIVRHDLRTGETIELISGVSYATGVLQPVLSPDGRLLAYARDVGGRTELRVRNLLDGDDRRVLDAIESSLAHQAPAFQGLLPRFSFTPDSRTIVIGYGGHLRRVAVDTGESQIIPFTARVVLDITRAVSPQAGNETGPVHARIIQAPRLSPDGKQVAFSAFGKLHVASVPGGKVRRLTRTPLSEEAATENHPSWSADGRWIVYASWSRREGGELWKIRSDGAAPAHRLTRTAGYYRKPAFTPDGRHVVAWQSSTYDQLHLVTPRGWGPVRAGAQQLVRVPANGGTLESLAYVPASTGWHDLGRIYFSGSAQALLAFDGQALMQVPSAGGVARRVMQVTVDATDDAASNSDVEDMQLSPDGRWVLVLQNSQLHLFGLPDGLRTERLVMRSPPAFHRQITQIGADDFGWSSDGAQVTWSVGNSFFRVSLQQLLEAGRPADAIACSDDSFPRLDIDVTLPRDQPDAVQLLRGPRVLTMRGAEVIDDADVLVRGDRIAAVGPKGSFAIPAGAVITDLSGKVLTPGFADTHAHYWRAGRQIIDYDSWEHRVALAYGITASIDPQAFTNDLFVYQDLIDAGVMRGPRSYTTGPGIFAGNRIASVGQARCILRRYRDHYRTPVVKSYFIGNRAQRRVMSQAAREMGMRLIAENWGSPRYALTHAIDGFATNEHASDAVDYFNDVARLYAATGTGYSPTTLIGGAAGLSGINYFLPRQDVLNDPKLNRFTPRLILEERIGGVTWQPADFHIGGRLAASAAKIFRAGGHVAAGGHGELQGLGYHWELRTLGMGGLTPHEALQIATRGSATVLGRLAEFGTVEAGKYADLVVFERDPGADLMNTTTLSLVMKNGRWYDTDTLRELPPAAALRPTRLFRSERITSQR